MGAYNRPFFIIGSFFILLFIIAALLIKSSIESNEQTIAPSSPYLVQTDDLLVTKNLTAQDLLPIDKPLVTFVDPQRGAAEPLIYIVEFSDFACPFCKESQKIIGQILAKYPDTIRHVWKDAPAEELHRDSMKAHLAARCAQKQNKFWEYHDQLFNEQGDFNNETLENIAQTVGLNLKKWQTCFEKKEEQAKIERGIIEAEVLGVDGIPYFFINNQRISGAVSFKELDQIIRAEIAKTE